MERVFPLLEEAFFKGIEAASPERAIPAHLKSEGGRLLVNRDGRWEDISPGVKGRLLIISTGKAAGGMYRAAVKVTGIPHVGIVASPDPHASCPGADHFRGGHPFPDSGSVASARAILSAMAGIGEQDTLLYLVSGGSSSVVALPEGKIPLKDKVAAIRAVMHAGASIFQLNGFRKAISRVKGGKLARGLGPCRAGALVISDVPGNDLSVIGSGPLFAGGSPPDPLRVIEDLSVSGKIPPSVMAYLREAREGETDVRPVASVPHVVIADNGRALEAAGTFLATKGYGVVISDLQYQGEALAAGISLGKRALSVREKAPPGKTAWICGGETVVTVRGRGRGGRNQELAIGAALSLDGTEGVAGLSAATDGIDGNSTAAGGFFDGRLIGRGRETGMDHEGYIAESDSSAFLSGTGYSFTTGPTGTNVMDLFLCLIDR